MKTAPTIELLESRIAPAAVFVSSKIATYTDSDGDLVKVSFSKAILTAGNVGSIVVETGNGLDNIDLTAAALDAHNVSLAKGATITVAVTSVVGDGFADVAKITATGIDLGAISMPKSRLVALDCGDDSVDGSGHKVDPTASIALPSLKVRAFGAVGSHVPTFLTPKLASYVDGDGDLVKVGLSLSILTPANVASVFVESASGLDEIDLTVIGKNASGVSLAKGISILQTVDNGKDAKGVPIVIGDGFADVGKITATGMDLGTVTMLKARLGEIDGIGDGALNGSNVFVDPTTTLPALKALNVRVFGILAGTNVPQFVTPFIAKYTDIDGDLVTVKLTKALFTPDNVATVLDLTSNGIENIDMTAFGKTAAGAYRAQGLGLSLTVTSVVGDGFANVGKINAPGIDLGVISMPKTDLGKIVCGDTAPGPLYNEHGTLYRGTLGVIDPTPKSMALTSLSVYSMGAQGLATQGGAGDLTTVLKGRVGNIKVASDVTDASLQIYRKFSSIAIGGSLTGHAVGGEGSIMAEMRIEKYSIYDFISTSGSISIGGDIKGGSANQTGYISTGPLGGLTKITVGGDIVGGSADQAGCISQDAYGAIGSILIGGDVVGGSGPRTGNIEPYYLSYGIGKLTIKGSLIGAAGTKSGYVKSSSISSLYIGGNIMGGSADSSGSVITTFAYISSLLVNGSIIGGSGNYSGYVQWGGPSIKVNGSLIGGDMAVEGAVLTRSGYIFADLAKNITIKGSIVGGVNNTSTGVTEYNGFLKLFEASSIVIGGGVIGNVGSGGQETIPAIIVASASAISIGGDVTHSTIGCMAPAADKKYIIPHLGSDKIGAITIGGNFTASNIFVGVGTGADLKFGTSDDSLAPCGADRIDRTFDPIPVYAKIANIIIKGHMTGTVGGSDIFGIQAEQIGKLSVHGVAVALTAGMSNDDITIGDSGDVRVRELTRTII